MESNAAAGQWVCDLHVPVNKTSFAFTKPVDEIVGDAVRSWEAERPEQPPLLDEKTGNWSTFFHVPVPTDRQEVR